MLFARRQIPFPPYCRIKDRSAGHREVCLKFKWEMTKVYKPRSRSRRVKNDVAELKKSAVSNIPVIERVAEECKHGLCMSPSEWYQNVQIAFQRSILSLPKELVSKQREQEWSTLEQFWQDNIITQDKLEAGRSIYISGPPGTGKSALISAFLASKQPLPNNVQLVQINCMTLKEPKKLQKYLVDQWYTETLDQDIRRPLNKRKKSLNEDNSEEYLDDSSWGSETNQAKQMQAQKWDALKKIFLSRNCTNTFVLVLDEMDQLLQGGSGSNGSFSSMSSGNGSGSSNASYNSGIGFSGSAFHHGAIDNSASFLYHLFEWSQSQNSRLVLIGIANAMDLMHHWIPRFSANQLPLPKQCHFSPFTIEQTIGILKYRIQLSIARATNTHASCTSNCSKISAPKYTHQGFHPVAMELCARKVASMGDFRKALDLCRLTVERAEKDYFDHLLESSNPLNENASKSYLVQLSHVQQAISLTFGSPLIQVMMDLNLHHQLVLMSIYLISTQGRQEASFSSVLQQYNQLCQEKHIQMLPLTRTEFQDSITLLEGKGLISMKKSSGSSLLSCSTLSSIKRKKSGSFGGAEGMMFKHAETKLMLRCTIDDLMKGLSHVPMLTDLLEKRIHSQADS